MVVYIANKPEHFKKIVDFLDRQPILSHRLQSFRKGIVGHSLGKHIDQTVLKEFLMQNKRAMMTIVEDEDGNVRLVGISEISSPAFKLKVKEKINVIIPDNDLKNGNFQFVDEWTHWISHYDVEVLGIKTAEHAIPEVYALGHTLPFYGDSARIIDQIIHPEGFGKYYIIHIDLEKYCKEHPK